MVRLFLFLLKVALLGAALLFLMQNAGDVHIHWQTYDLKTSTTVLVVLIFILMTGAFFFSRLIWRLKNFSFSFSRFFRIRTLSTLENSFQEALESFAAQETKKLIKDLGRLCDLVHHKGLRHYLKGKQAFFKDSPKAWTRFQELSSLPQYAFLGHYELTQKALKDREYNKALFYAEHAYGAYKKSPWACKTLFTLLLREESYEHAHGVLNVIERQEMLCKQEIRNLKAGVFYKKALLERDLHIQEKNLETALDWVPHHLPSGLALGNLLIQREKFRQAFKVIETVWGKNPHPDLVPLYNAQKDLEPVEKAQRMEDLHGLAPHSVISLECAARVYMHAHLWGKARSFLNQIPPEYLTTEACFLWIQLEREEYQDTDKIQMWIDRMRRALPNASWYCTQCSTPSLKWYPVCHQCLHLDTIRYGHPLPLLAQVI